MERQGGTFKDDFGVSIVYLMARAPGNPKTRQLAHREVEYLLP
jgi:hypothetical protein